jgi:hypothetical protein
MNQLTQSALLGMLTVCLGFFIKKWIQSLDNKIDTIVVELNGKASKRECIEHVQMLEKRCEKRDKKIKSLAESDACKCESDLFLNHSHTEKGKIVLN